MYRCDFLGAGGAARSTEMFDATCDEEAISLGRRMFAQRGDSIGFEILRDGSPIHLETGKSSRPSEAPSTLRQHPLFDGSDY
ncbi:MAG TPA: hypothetical protein VMG55_17320 [Stellaceae bacterium]|nr:hypothetical protein [Stellaceae bacterium]